MIANRRRRPWLVIVQPWRPRAAPVTILYLSDIRFPLERANGIQSMETCAALARRGHDVHLLVRPDTHAPPRDPLAFYGLPASPRLGFERADVFGPPPARRAAYLARAIERVLERRRWDLVFTRDLGIADLALRLPARLRPPVVHESHLYAPVFAATRSEMLAGERSAGRFKINRLERRERRVWRAADGYVTITGILAAELRERFGSRPRVITAPSGARLDPQREYAPPRPAEHPLLAYAGHFYPWKGADVLVEALALLPGARGLLIGGQPRESDRGRLEALARSLGVDDRVTFTGPAPPSEVPKLLAAADILVLPTVDMPSTRYTSPLKLFEYLAAGRPIVASDLPPLREVVEHGRTARLVKPADPAALAEGVRAVIGDPAVAERMARAAFERAADYSWDRRAERLERLFGEVLASTAAGRAPGGGEPSRDRLR